MTIRQHNGQIISANFLVDNKRIPLEEKPEGATGLARCHFYTQTIDNYRFEFRIDWKDIDENNNPRLDVNIYTKDGKEFKIGKKQWHHTSKTIHDGKYTYIWKPINNELQKYGIEFILQTTNRVTFSMKARVVQSK
jgi:hypothetical protein